LDLWPAQEVFIDCVRGLARAGDGKRAELVRELGEALMVKV
jgi:hypothetical protein